jgi:hypothetical protein
MSLLARALFVSKPMEMLPSAGGWVKHNTGILDGIYLMLGHARVLCSCAYPNEAIAVSASMKQPLWA